MTASNRAAAAAAVAEIKIYARASHGRFTRLRWLTLWLTQLVFYGLPWLNWNGRQAVLFDLEARRFYLFNLVLYPQDFIYLTLLLIACALGLFLVTTLAGRVWCGFACPQTVYTKLFMWIQRRFEGDRSARMRRDAAPWSTQGVLRKAGTRFTWISISLWTGFTFVAYFTPAQTLGTAVWSGGLGPWETFWICFYALALYGNAGHLREQVCKHMCPYARFQSAMFDRDTLIIGYDTRRGEPRAARNRTATSTNNTAVPTTSHASAPGTQTGGDCINCTLCVQVCPTGIDIRDGLQSNCIGCAACIDACDAVMDKIGAPRGLVRYATQNRLDALPGPTGAAPVAATASALQWLRPLARPRVLVYTALLLVTLTGLAVGLAGRAALKVNVIRDRGVLSRVVDGGAVENIYRLQLVNTREHSQAVRVEVRGQPGLSLAGGGRLELALRPLEERSVPVTVRLAPAAQPSGHALAFSFRIQPLDSQGTATPPIEEPSRFLLPN